jgi:hypothetical protein
VVTASSHAGRRNQRQREHERSGTETQSS